MTGICRRRWLHKGYEVLRDARTTVAARGEKIDLVGVRYWTQRAREIARLVRGAQGTVILLAHDPRRLSEAASLDIPLVLSGHTHGGQVVLPGIGAVAARKFPVVAGIGRRENTSIYVSRGVGTVYVPYRFNCPPDVSVITLKSARLDKTPPFHFPPAIQQELNRERVEVVFLL